MLLHAALSLALAIIIGPTLTRQELQTKQEADRPVRSEELRDLIAQADKIAVYDYADVDNVKLLYSSTNAKVISTLEAAMLVEPSPDEDRRARCLCTGYPEILVFRQNKELVRFSFVQGTFVRASIWTHEAHILDEEKVLRWFDARGMHRPRRESREQHAEEAVAEADEQRWMKAMPASVRPLWPQTIEARPFEGSMSIFVPQGSAAGSKTPAEASTYEREVRPEIQRLAAELAKEFPDPNQRIRVLFAWFGSGNGAWTGYPEYEGIVEELLLEYKTPELLAALDAASLSEPEQEGAARLFAGFAFKTLRLTDNALLPAELKRLLLAHSLKGSDKDKKVRARLAFAR
jgi:hypothetical protein